MATISRLRLSVDSANFSYVSCFPALAWHLRPFVLRSATFETVLDVFLVTINDQALRMPKQVFDLVECILIAIYVNIPV